MRQQMVLPKLNEAGDDATVFSWLVSIGDTITLDMPIMNMEMEKTDVELCSTVTGKLVRQLVARGDVVKVGQPIMEVE